MSQLLNIHPDNPNPRYIKMVLECLEDGGVIIYPTDTVYGMGCDPRFPKALDRLAQIKGIRREKADFSLICHDLKQLSDYARPIGNDVFRMMKRLLPGPYTFILEANNNVPKIFQSKKKTVGIRVPDNNIITTIVREYGHALANTSIHDSDDTMTEYITDPELIYERYEKQVDLVIDGGYGDNEGSTIIDCSGDDLVLVRQGKGSVEGVLMLRD
ncbi:MAG: threonylcarbamoyl-AMP synthase [Bacteroidetes bacterium GWE2_42_24]|nr:MAG: threonylcarbamoyl-AMP synthase [Bacteroidetes bacterium GWE2_42_24]OFY25428.1 MAG: threonylcarbamoyl-AMP synthase [Bacteroidetes bacterium GWF2_43_11]